MASSPMRRASYPSRSLSLVCKRLTPLVTIPTVCLSHDHLVHCHINRFRRVSSVARPSHGGEKRQPCEHRIMRNCAAMVSLLLPCSTTGLSLIAGWCLMGETPRGQPSMCRPVPRQFMRNALLDLTTIVLATACHQSNDVETYSRFTEAHVEGVWVRSTFLRTVGYFIPSVVETQCLTDHQVIGVHTIDLMQFHVPRA